MKYEAVFWDIDGTMYEPPQEIPKNEWENIFRWYISKVIPANGFNWLVPYAGLAELMKQIPRTKQGIITNGNWRTQVTKLCLLTLMQYVDQKLIFTPDREARRVREMPDHPLRREYSLDDSGLVLRSIEFHMQKPNAYLFERALEVKGVPAERCVMIGNDWRDVRGAQHVGMKTVYMAGTGSESGPFTAATPDSDQYFDPIAEGLIIPDYTIQKGDIKTLTELLI